MSKSSIAGTLLLFSCSLFAQSASSAASPASSQDSPSSTAAALPVANTPVPIPANIHQLYIDDQSDRGVKGLAPSGQYGADRIQRDTMRREEARSLMSAGELKTAQDFHDAAFIFQHGLQADDYLLAHILAIEAIVKGDASSKWIAASTLDRYLQAIGKSQVFGTQYSGSTNEKGTTQEPYDRILIPDALRNDFCVPDLAQQKKNLKDFDAGQYPIGIIPPGCTR
jgi:hypothetical protein